MKMLFITLLSIGTASAFAEEVLIVKASSSANASCSNGYNPPSSLSTNALGEAEKECVQMGGLVKDTKCNSASASKSNWIGHTSTTAVACVVVCEVAK